VVRDMPEMRPEVNTLAFYQKGKKGSGSGLLN
jgi:hypothetical protein